MTAPSSLAEAVAKGERDLEYMHDEGCRLGAISMSVRVAVNKAARVDVLVERTRPDRDSSFGPPTIRCESWDEDMAGHGRIVHRATLGLRRPRPVGTATVTVEADMQQVFDQIDREVAEKWDRVRATQWWKPRKPEADIAPLVCGSSGLEDAERTRAPKWTPPVIDYERLRRENDVFQRMRRGESITAAERASTWTPGNWTPGRWNA